MPIDNVITVPGRGTVVVGENVNVVLGVSLYERPLK